MCLQTTKQLDKLGGGNIRSSVSGTVNGRLGVMSYKAHKERRGSSSGVASVLTLDRLLQNSEAVGMFASYCEGIDSMDQLQFWSEVEVFQNMFL